MSEHAWLEDAAAFYDLDLRGHDEDVAFWVNLAHYCDGPVLEVGCGTGRITRAIAGAGLDVTAIDVAPAMLRRARRSLAAAGFGDVPLVAADVRAFELGRRFDLVAVPLAGFCHLLSAGDQLAALRSMALHLTEGGVLALDLPVLEPAQWQPGDRRLRREWRRKDADGRWVEKWAMARPDFAHQLQRISYEYRVEGGPATVRIDFDLRYVFPTEVEHLLASAGLAVADLYGSYDLEPFDTDASRMLVLARHETAATG